MDAERLAMIGALVQQQNQNFLRLQQAVDRRTRKRRRDRVVLVRQWILKRHEHPQNTAIPTIVSPINQCSLPLNQCLSNAVSAVHRLANARVFYFFPILCAMTSVVEIRPRPFLPFKERSSKVWVV